jgi:alpha-tubulin suppressor-like RCC1 family protein
MAWGSNLVGQLGDGTTTERTEPVDVSGLSDVKAVSAGGDFSLALRKNGTVMAWGYNEEGELGSGNETSSDVPVAVKDLNGVKAVAAGLNWQGAPATGCFGLALRNNGTVMAWGNNEEGQLGDGGLQSSDIPVPVSGLSHVKAISAGGAFGLALLQNGTVMSWGDNSGLQLGNGTTVNNSNIPVPVSGLSNVKAIATGDTFALALLADGTVMAWGVAVLGDGTTNPSDVPVSVEDLSNVKAISAGYLDSLARLSNGTVMTWGEIWGTGKNASNEVPVAVGGLSHIRHVAGGLDFNLAS